MIEVTIKHHANDRLLWLIEKDLLERKFVKTGIWKDCMIDDSNSMYFMLSFGVAHEIDLIPLFDRLFWNEIQAGECLSYPVGVKLPKELS